MLGDPRVLILDEPANGLDPEGIRWMRDLLKALAGEGRTILVSSHLLSEMELLADDVVIIAAGKLIAAGPGRRGARLDVGGRPGPGAHADADELTAAAQRARRRRSPQRAGRRAAGHRGRGAGDRRTPPCAAGVELHELATERPDLEQVFLELTAGKAGIR